MAASTTPAGSRQVLTRLSEADQEENTDGDTQPDADEPPLSPPVSCPAFFGVKSYLHQFYEPRNADLFGAESEKSQNRCCSARSCWKMLLWFGANLLVLGLIGLVVSYIIPIHKVAVANEDELTIVDKTAIEYNYRLDFCRLVGLVVFTLGGLICGITLCVGSCFGCADGGSNKEESRGGWTTSSYRVGPDADLEKRVSGEKVTKIPASKALIGVQPSFESS